jgi:hypothetical protein
MRISSEKLIRIRWLKCWAIAWGFYILRALLVGINIFLPWLVLTVTIRDLSGSRELMAEACVSILLYVAIIGTLVITIVNAISFYSDTKPEITERLVLESLDC